MAATITISTTFLLGLNAALLLALVAAVFLRRSALVRRHVTIERLNPTLHRVGQMGPDDFVIMSLPELTDEETDVVRDDMAEAGMLNIVVTNRKIDEVKKGNVDVDGEVTKPDGRAG